MQIELTRNDDQRNHVKTHILSCEKYIIFSYRIPMCVEIQFLYIYRPPKKVLEGLWIVSPFEIQFVRGAYSMSFEISTSTINFSAAGA